MHKKTKFFNNIKKATLLDNIVIDIHINKFFVCVYWWGIPYIKYNFVGFHITQAQIRARARVYMYI